VERAVFDPLASVTLGHETVHGERLRGQGIRESFITGTPVAEGAIEQLFPTGTSVALEGETGIDDVTQDRQLVRTRFGMTVTQALLRGAGREANLARIRQARLDTLATEYELRGFAEMLVATVEQTFWEYLGAKREVEVIRESVKQAEGELANVRERVKAGMVPELEVAAAEAEVALRRQDVVDVRARAEKARLLLVRLMNPAGSDVWSREVRIPEQAVTADDVLDDVEAHVGVALRLRPELNQARIGIKRGDLELVRTRNGLLPRLDLFVTLGKSGYAGSFGGSYGNVPGDSYDFLVGVRAEYPLMNREARADHRRATLDRRQAEEAVKNLAQLVQVDVRTAYVEVMRARELAEAAGITRKYDEAKLKVEQEKYGIGRASSFQVARAQRDLLKSGISELRAMIEQRKALVELYRLEGSLLERRGIAAPGKEPVDVSAKSEAGTRQ
jgi:outer membrane protein TolC